MPDGSIWLQMLKEEIMSEKLYPVLPEAKKNTLIDNETYLEWYEESVSDPDGLGQARPAYRLVQAFHQGQRTPISTAM